MLFKKITYLKSFGCYINYNWDANIPEFCQYNFIYGWNYSGKTTLSKLFRTLGTKQIHPDFSDSEFKIITDNGEITHHDIGNDYSILVFNEEFISDNFDWNNDNHEIEPLLILGKESKDLEEKLTLLNEEVEAKQSDHRNILANHKSRETELQNLLTSKATEIRAILNITNQREFDRNALEKKITETSDNYGSYILPDDKYQKLIDVIRDTTVYETLKYPELNFKLAPHILIVYNLLSKKVNAQQLIEKLKSNLQLSNWVRDGIELHKDKETECQFCGNVLPSDLFERLEKHFSEEYKNLIKDINYEITILGKLKSNIEEISQSLIDKARILRECQNEYETATNDFKTELSLSNELIQKLIDKLTKKKDSPFDELSLENFSDNDKSLRRKLTLIKYILRHHNTKIRNFEEERTKVKDQIIYHHSALFVKYKHYLAYLRLFKIYSSILQKLSGDISSLENQIEAINSQIISGAIGADKMNEYLGRFFNDNKLTIKRMDNGRYKLFRDLFPAKNLSTGERNIISLIYFFTKLEESHFDLNCAIIFIDDPVSSLDSNHIFGVYGFLSEKLKECGQLFISTHNFDFYNLLKDYKRYDLSNKGNLYLIKRTQSNILIESLPKVLEKFKSEYNYLFSILYEFNKAVDKNNFEALYILPNILRRFFEAFLYMKYPNKKNFKGKYSDYFTSSENITEKQKSLKLMDEYSHEWNPEHSHKFPEVQEIEQAVKFILDTISQKDSEHYKALEDSLMV